MICYVVIDTNVLVSALLSKHKDSATVQVLETLFLQTVIPVYSNDILKEYYEVLSRKKFNFSLPAIIMLIDFIKNHGECINPTPTGEILLDMKDLPFYEVIMEKENDNSFLITGNIKHFPSKPFIVTPREFIEYYDEFNAE